VTIPIEILAILLGTVLTIIIGVQAWMLLRIFNHERRLTKLELRLQLHLNPEPKAGDTEQVRRWAAANAASI
jgi:hypothetical protein